MTDFAYRFPNHLTFSNAHRTYQALMQVLTGTQAGKPLRIDARELIQIDSAGAVIIRKLQQEAMAKAIDLRLENLSEIIIQTLDLFKIDLKIEEAPKADRNFFEKVGQIGYQAYKIIIEITFLLSNVSYWGFVAFFKPKLRRRGEVINQSILIGVNALPIIGLIAFLIGFILALQSAAQLRQFGANIFVADLVAIAMISEMGPLITAIMVAGRSGSAIAAEIATMKVSEEIDALKVMGIDPIPYLIVPKLFAITITMPLLTTFANLIGIIGGMVIGLLYLDIGIVPFYHEVIYVLRYKEIVIYLLKSVCFAGIIVLTATFFGLRVKGGAEGVGRSTTASVVFSIFLVIVADSIIGLLFYFE